jgi:Transposase and inactivated derivatives
VVGGFLIQEKLVLEKTKRRRLGLSKIGFFTLILHRVFPESQVSQVCVKLYPSSNPRFLVEEPEAEEQSSKEPKKVVSVDLGIARLATLSDGRFFENPRSLECSLDRIRVLQRSLSRKRFLSKNWLKTKIRLAKQHERVKDFRRDSLNSGRYSHRSTTFWCWRIWMSKA